MRTFLTIGLMLSVIGCADMSRTPSAQSGSTPKDGELAFPSDYKSYPTFIQGIQKPNAVRDLYINQIGAKAGQGEPFANGSVLVMEIYNAKKDGDGSFVKDRDGHLVKNGLAKVFVMQKGAGWGNNAPQSLKNGDWIYSAFNSNGDRLNVEYCQVPKLPYAFRG